MQGANDALMERLKQRKAPEAAEDAHEEAAAAQPPQKAQKLTAEQNFFAS